MYQLGTLRPSQFMFTFGIGSLVDLPNMSVMVMGLDDWDETKCPEILEDRLVAAIQKQVGAQMQHLRLPPPMNETQLRDPTARAVGVPVAPFPRWLRCTACGSMATVDSGVFTLRQDRWRGDKTGYVHGACNMAHAVPVRFLMACRDGHLSDFDWIGFVHKNKKVCEPSILRMSEYGVSGDASDIIIKCESCGSSVRMDDAFDKNAEFVCNGHHPHLREFDSKCDSAKPILLGASNNWFPVKASALSIPRVTDSIGKQIDAQWSDLHNVESLEELAFMRKKQHKFASLIGLFTEHSDDAIWAAMEAKRAGSQTADVPVEDLKRQEWQVFSGIETVLDDEVLKIRRVAPPKGFEDVFEDTLLLDKIREVHALLGFTRLESRADFVEALRNEDMRRTKISRKPPTWLPAVETHGEGILLRFREDVLCDWDARPEVRTMRTQFHASHEAWCMLRNRTASEVESRGMRLVLLHSFAHALMRQITLECGYSAAGVRERLYCRDAHEDGGPMAGILIYTAASDSEGTLGGLVALGDPLTLGRHASQACESMRVCSSDPLCAEHGPDREGRGIHGAACHACLFAPETSCEHSNLYLDRSVLVETFASRGAELF